LIDKPELCYKQSGQRKVFESPRSLPGFGDMVWNSEGIVSAASMDGLVRNNYQVL
jgi:hypothetical protein